MMSERGRGLRRRGLAAAIAVAVLAAAGCKDGRPPYEVIDQKGPSESFIPPPPVGIAPGITHELGLLYRFDRTRYRLFTPLAGTDPRFVRRDSVLALASAANPGAPLDLLYRPDLSDPVLANVYANPRLFGFVNSDVAQTGFVEGSTVTDAYRYFPSQVGNWWETNHNELEWTVVDSVIGPGSAPTAGGMPVFQLRTYCDVAPQLEATYLPAIYGYDTYMTAEPGIGILFHAWNLVSEREYRPNPERPQREYQRNPRWLWLSLQSLDFSRDPQAFPQVTIDQCLDGLPSHLTLFPFQMTGDTIQEGDIYRTWTYLEVDPDVLRERLASEGGKERGGRCGQPVVVGRDTLTMFPTRTFKLLCQIEARCERIVGQVELRRSGLTTGLYPITPSPGAVVQFRVTMSIFEGPQQAPVQFLELWYLRDIGQVVRRQGLNPRSRVSARLARCLVNGIVYEQPNSTFIYRP